MIPLVTGTSSGLSKAGKTALLLAALLMAGSASAQLVSQSPLHVRGFIPGNLALTPSVEFPTLNSVANLGNYSENTVYVGYFDSGKCYQYHYSATESERHFYPVHTTSNRRCTDSSAPWGGNFLNWAATQTIDPFRKALTGGLRVRDDATDNASERIRGTWLEKARHDGQGSYFPNRRLPAENTSRNTLNRNTPFDVNSFMRMSINGRGNEMRFRIGDDNVDHDVRHYDPAGSSGTENACTSRGCRVTIRVRVCVPGLEESNCKQYGNASKPEGTLQEYAGRMRYAAFSYLKDNAGARDGGVLRAQMKFIGPTMPQSGIEVTNPNAEWNPATGVFIQDPDGNAPSNGYSGVINYLNRFGQLDGNNKNFDPVSELYYTALRYFRNLGHVPEYSSGYDATQADGFPVITNWTDPVQHWCQSNVILGIGDVYTHMDKNLPGNTECRSNEPTMPTAVSDDTALNVVRETDAVGAMEGLGEIGSRCDFSGRSNSAYIAGMSWFARSRDIRPDLSGGRTTISTYWVDVMEGQRLESIWSNQYALATKYGGARLPVDFDHEAWGNEPLPEAWWHANGETLTDNGANLRRPDNFFTAGRANDMVESLSTAFKSIASEQVGSGAALGTTSTQLDVGTRSFQAQFFSETWHGELSAYALNPSSGALLQPALWSASSRLGPSARPWNQRNIYVNNLSGTAHVPFLWDNLAASQRAQLGSQAAVEYLKGNRTQEQANGGALRNRTGILGGIVQSQPVYVGSPNPVLHVGRSYAGGSAYTSFVNTNNSRRPIVYVGANDGMLHGFDAQTGDELYAFVPNTVIQNGLKNYTEPGYEHRYFVDGELTTAPVWDGTQWRTVLIGTLGRGGPGIFSLDVTDPFTPSGNSTPYQNGTVNIEMLWEKNGTDIPGLGKNIGKPIIAQVADGKWRVILGNGADSGSGAQLVMIDAVSGEHITKSASSSTSNGLSAVYTWDSNGDGFIDTAYAGDLEGNLWRFGNLSASTSGEITVTKVFEQSRPITAAPLVGIHPSSGERWVFFGTGRYLGEADTVATTTVESWYGLIDPSVESMTPILTSDLVERRIVAEGTVNGTPARVIEEGSSWDFTSNGKSGWYIQLKGPSGAQGERMVVPNLFQGRVLVGTTREPISEDVCRPSGSGWVMAIDPFTGGRLPLTFFDLSLDGNFDQQDMMLVDGEWVPVSGVGFRSSPNSPVFVGNAMQTSHDDGSVNVFLTSGGNASTRRSSWREIVGN